TSWLDYIVSGDVYPHMAITTPVGDGLWSLSRRLLGGARGGPNPSVGGRAQPDRPATAALLFELPASGGEEPGARYDAPHPTRRCPLHDRERPEVVLGHAVGHRSERLVGIGGHDPGAHQGAHRGPAALGPERHEVRPADDPHHGAGLIRDWVELLSPDHLV